MKYNDIILKANNYKGIFYTNMDLSERNKQIKKNIFEILKKCIVENINFDLTEEDIKSIIIINHEINNIYIDDFIIDIINLNKNKVNITKILKIIKE